MNSRIFKILGGIAALLLLILSVFPAAVTASGMEDFVGVQFILDNQGIIMSVIVVAWVVNAFIASLVSQGAVSFSAISTALKDISQGEAFTRAEQRFGGDMNIKKLADTITAAKMLIPKDSELWKLLNQVEATLIDLFDGPDEGDIIK